MSKEQRSKFLNWLADLGQNWAMASDPAVMQASGYKSTPEGVKHEDSAGAKQLRENLAVLGGTVNTLTNIGLSGIVPALSSEAGAVVGGIAGNKIGEKIDERVGTTYWAPVLGFTGAMIGGSAPYTASRYWNGLKTAWNSGKTVRPEYSNWGGEFVDDVAVNSKQHYLPKKSKLSVDELAGIPKSERVVETPEYLELKQVYNEFADTYGYPRTRAKTYEELVRDSRKIINRHNTFLRGVGMSDELIKATPGMTDEKRLIYAATQPYVEGERIWVTPGTINAFGYGCRDPRKVFAVRLPVPFEGDPKTWFKKYYPIKKGSQDTLDDIIVAPWGSETNNEYLVKGPLTSIFSTSAKEAHNGKIPATLVTRRSGHGLLAPWDKQWDAAYFRALSQGDIEKAQFLRDLHFHDASILNRLISGQKPIKLYHNTDKSFTEFDLSKIGTNNDPGFYGHGIYTSPDSKYSSTYGPKQMVLYGNLTNPFVTNGDLVKSAQSYNFGRSFDYTLVDIPSGIRRNLENADGVIHTGPSYLRGGQPIEEVVFSEPSQLKLADVITYDDAGNIIPLSQRDNFEIKDLRYVAFPAAAVGGGISLIKNNSTQNGK